jgi:putative peptidoglycan lipid II flippase
MTAAAGPVPAVAVADPGAAQVQRASRHAIGATLASRTTGMVRLVVTAAVLGPTFLGNIFQSVNLLPNLVYGLVGGALLAGLVVPVLVGPLDRGDPARAREIGGRILWLLLAAGAVLTALTMAAAPLLARVLTADTPDAVAADGRRVAALLVLFVAPQLLAYIVCGVAAAAQHAVGRYGLSLGGFVIENLGVIAGLLLVASAFGVGRDVGTVSSTEIVALALAGTIPPFVHAAVQLTAAHRCGASVRPRAAGASRDPVIRSVMRQAVPSVASATLICARYFLAAVVVSGVAGGWVALQVGLTFLVLPSGLIARPLSTLLLGTMTRLWSTGDIAACRAVYRQALAQVNFLAVPAAVGLCALAWPVAEVVSRGAMGEAGGVRLVAWCLVAVGLGVIGDSLFEVTKAAALSCRAADTVFGGMAVRVGTSLVALGLLAAASRGGVGAWHPEGAQLAALAGATVALGDLVGAWILHRRFERVLRSRDVNMQFHRVPLGWARVLPAAVAMGATALVAAAAVDAHLPASDGLASVGRAVVLLLILVLAAAVYLGINAASGSPEFATWRQFAGRAGSAGPGLDMPLRANGVQDPELGEEPPR